MNSGTGSNPAVGDVRPATSDAKEARLSALIGALSARLDQGALLMGDDVGDAYLGDATDARGPRPALVLRPRDTADVSLILSTCNDLGQPLVIQGGRTGLSGGARPCEGEVSLSLERMTRLESVDLRAGTVVVEAGVTMQSVQEAAEEAGFLFGVDIGARGSCTVGGNIATNAGGIRVLRYGMYRAQVLGLETVLPDGSVLSSLKGLPKDNSGYDLNQCFIGSEGTLGVVTKACLRLHPLPPLQVNALCALPSLAAAQALLARLRQELGPLLSAFEVIFPEVYAGVAAGGFATPPLPVGAGLYALVEIQGQDKSENHERFAATLMSAVEAGLVDDVVVSQSPRDYRGLWALREACSAFIFSMDRMVGFDVSIPLARMQDFLTDAAVRLLAIDSSARPYVFGHLGDGNLHYMVRTDRYEDIADAVFAVVAETGGAISAEHGIGLDKKKWLPLVRSASEIAAMRRMKRAFDPNLILNPGRVFDMETEAAGKAAR